jgi:hypothetical protein
MSRSIHRRRLLQGLGAAVLASPFLWRIPSAMAAPKKRFVVFFTPNEWIDRAHWAPSPAGGGAKPLPATLPAMFAPLEPMKNRLVLVGDLENRGGQGDHNGGHKATGQILTGCHNVPYGAGEYDFWGGGVSIDQHLAKQWGCEALTLGVRPGPTNGGSRISYTGPSAPEPPVEDPHVAFQKCFGDFLVPKDELETRRAQQRRVLAAVALDLGRLRGRLPALDGEKLQVHLDHLLALKSKLEENPGTLSCQPQAVNDNPSFEFADNKDLPITARRHIDVLVQALACGVTRVGSLQIGNSGGSGITPLWPAEGLEISTNAHDLSHSYNSDPAANEQARVKLEQLYSKLFLYLLQSLEGAPDGSGTTLLDNTLVMWVKPMGAKHADSPLLFVLAGGAGGALATGRFLSFPNRPHNDLLSGICNLMGLADKSFGDPGLCEQPLSLS